MMVRFADVRHRVADTPHGRTARSTLAWSGLLVSAAFSYLAVRHVHFRDVWRGLRTNNYWWLVPALAMLAVTVFVKALRWRYLFAKETRPGVRPVLSSLLIGYFFNSILPARAGEAARVLALKRRAGTSGAEAAATVVLERIYDVLVLLVLLFLALPWLPRITWLHAAVLLAVALAGGFAVGVVVLSLFGLRPIHFALRPLAWLPFVSADQLLQVGENLGQGLAGIRKPRLILGALFWTALGWLAVALSTWFVLRGFRLGLSPVAGLLVVIAVNLAQILPASPSAVGVFEAATLVALRAYDISYSRALSCALVLHALNFIPYVAAGLVLLRSTLDSPRRKTVRKSAVLTAKSPLRRGG
jgi:glycosyltransferase 2 family protein